MQYFFVFNQAFYCSKQIIRFPLVPRSKQFPSLASVPSSSPSRLRSKRMQTQFGLWPRFHPLLVLGPQDKHVHALPRLGF